MTSQTYRDSLFAENNGEVIVLLLTIQHPQLTEEIRLSSDNGDLLDFEEQARGTISRGLAFRFIPMEVKLPEQGDEVTPTLTITLSDVALSVAPILESTATPAFVTTEVVLASSPSHVEQVFPVFRLTAANIQGDSISLDLVVDSMGDEPFPADNFTPAGFPGLWVTF